MELPNDILKKYIGDSFASGKVYLFKNINHSPDSPKHYHLAMKTNDDNYLIIALITSQVQKVKQHCSSSNSALLDSLVIVGIKDISCLTKESVINCNDASCQTKEELVASISGDIKYIDAIINNNLEELIKNAIKKSPMIKPYIKEMIS